MQEYYERADGQIGVVKRLNSTDDSPIYRGYDSECGLCWGGFTHSENVHENRIAKKKKEGNWCIYPGERRIIG